MSAPIRLPGNPADIALVLGGGGAKGSYEIGVFAALRRLGVSAGAVLGVSVGALNGAMYAMGAFEEAEALWAEVRLADLVSEDMLPLAERAEEIMNRPDRLLDMAAKYSRNKGIDITPFRELLARTVREDRLRAAPVRFSLTATRLNGLTLTEMDVREMAPGTLVDWLLASAACFPAFPMQTIGGELYADGGFCDNVPVAPAIRAGARHVIAVDIGKRRSHRQYDLRPNVTYIRASHPLGGLLTFDPQRAAFNRQLGLNDTLRAFGALLGFSYSFAPDALDGWEEEARRYLESVSRLEAALQPTRALRFSSGETAPFFSLLEEEMTGVCDDAGYYLRSCELTAELAGLSPLPVYTMDSLRDALLTALPFAKARLLAGGTPAGFAGALLAKPSIDRRLIVTALAVRIRAGGMDTPLIVRTAGAFPREFLCALLLVSLFGDALTEAP